MKKYGGQGFTIVELLIVVVIIGILAALVIMAYNGVTQKAYYNRSQDELSSLAKAVQIFQSDKGRYPNDVTRGIPAEITPYINGSVDSWPNAPWPDSVYDYDYFVGSDGREVSQLSIRFCPASGTVDDCHFPNETWANGFGVDSSAYWCITGKCRAHPSQAESYPGYCINCSRP